MGCFTFYIFNRQGVCQYYHEWARPKPVTQGAGSQVEDFKLTFGLFWSMKTFAAAMDPKRRGRFVVCIHCVQLLLFRSTASSLCLSTRLQADSDTRQAAILRVKRPLSLSLSLSLSPFNLYLPLPPVSHFYRPAGKQQVGGPCRVGDGATFRSFTTTTYKMHYLETPSGLKFVLTTDPSVGHLDDHLAHVYAALFVELVAKNPAYSPGDPFL
jgi:hypothetical protein